MVKSFKDALVDMQLILDDLYEEEAPLRREMTKTALLLKDLVGSITHIENSIQHLSDYQDKVEEG